MSVSVVFVHGITVREDRFARLLRSVRFGLLLAGAEVDVKGCYWGDIAAIDKFPGLSIPSYRHGARGVAADPADPSWLEDPLGGLRRLRDPEDLEPLHGLAAVPESVRLRNTALAGAQAPIVERLGAVLPEVLDPDQSLPDHALPRLTLNVLEMAAKANRTLTAVALIHDIAEALVASVFVEASGGTAGPDTEFHWTTAYEAAAGALSEQFGAERGGHNLGARILTTGLRWGGRKAAMNALAIGIGDVLVHASHREQILKRLDQEVRRIPDDNQLVLVGHSLGGVIAFEYCRIAYRPVQHLVTVGSQVGLFGELGVYGRDHDRATGQLRRGADAGTWVNLYDPADALGFLAGPVFPDVTDIEIVTGAPFPVCHSEYWNRTQTYRHLCETLQ